MNILSQTLKGGKLCVSRRKVEPTTGTLRILSLTAQVQIFGDNTGKSSANVPLFFMEPPDNKVVFVDQFNIEIVLCLC